MDKDLFLKSNSLTTEELCEIYYNLNGFRWDNRIGEKPEGFDNLPTRRYKWYHIFTRRTTKKRLCRANVYDCKRHSSRRRLYALAQRKEIENND